MEKCKGNGVVPVTARSIFSIQSSGEFHIQAHDKSGLLQMMGPPSSTDRFLRVRIPVGCTHIHIKCKPSIVWTTTEALYNDQEIPDPRPKEMPTGFHRPETLESMVQRFVQTAVSERAEKAGAETFEEANDFDIDDPFDMDVPDSEYTELEEEEPLPLDVPENPEAEMALAESVSGKTKEPGASCPAASAPDSGQAVQPEATPAPASP